MTSHKLTKQEVLERLEKYGMNTIETESHFSILNLFLTQFPTTINIILFIAGVASLIIKDILDAVFILAIIFINGCFGFFQEYRAQKSLEKLKEYAVPEALVIRSNGVEVILAEKLVPDDTVIIEEG